MFNAACRTRSGHTAMSWGRVWNMTSVARGRRWAYCGHLRPRRDTLSRLAAEAAISKVPIDDETPEGDALRLKVTTAPGCALVRSPSLHGLYPLALPER